MNWFLGKLELHDFKFALKLQLELHALSNCFAENTLSLFENAHHTRVMCIFMR